MRMTNKRARAIVNEWMRGNGWDPPTDDLPYIEYVMVARRLLGIETGVSAMLHRPTACQWLRNQAEELEAQ